MSKPPSNARPYALPKSLFIFIYATIKAEEAGENGNSPKSSLSKKKDIWKEANQ